MLAEGVMNMQTGKTYEIKKIPIWPVVRLVFWIFLGIGLLIGILYAVLFSGIGFLASIFSNAPMDPELRLFQRFGFLLIPFIAVVYTFFGTIGAFIWTLIYNLVASIAGGIEISLVEKGTFKGNSRIGGDIRVHGELHQNISRSQDQDSLNEPDKGN
jgi:hypothetical protein